MIVMSSFLIGYLMVPAPAPARSWAAPALMCARCALQGLLTAQCKLDAT